jgi:hypothetical protein
MEPEEQAYVDVAKDQLRILLMKMRSDCACHALGWCTLLELEVASHRDPRMLIQFKCIEKYKYVLSEDAGHEIHLNEATERWIAEGFARKFGEIYKPTTSFNDYDIERLFLSVMR